MFLLRAAIVHDPNQVADSRAFMLRLSSLMGGRWFPALITVGVIAYAVDQAVHARWRRIRPIV